MIPVILRTMLQEAGPPPLMRRALRGRKAGHDCFLTNHLKLGFRDHCRRGTGHRWQIDWFCRALKQSLQIKTLGGSRPAVSLNVP